ncbi:MAG: right-handed parallel beta-helix repeat-containing protein [bacterium]
MKRENTKVIIVVFLLISFFVSAQVVNAAVIYVPVDFDTIQEAVDNAIDGDVIYVSEGTYQECVLIEGVDVELFAVGEVTIVSPEGGCLDDENIDRGIVQIYDSITTIDGFILDGAMETMIGIYARGMSENEEAEVEVKISNNRVCSFKKNGITINGDMATGNIFKNTVKGSGPVGTGNWAQNGIQFGYGATGNAMGNTVSCDWYLGQDWAACGILIFESNDVTVQGNLLENNETGIGIETWGWYKDTASKNKVVNNIINGSDWGVTVSAYSMPWVGYSNMDCAANNNKIVNNTIIGPGTVGVAVGAYDYNDDYDPSAVNNKVINNKIKNYDEAIADEGDTTKVRANKIPVL